MAMVQCGVCGRAFAEEAVIKMGEYFVCSECKPVFLQRLREGASLTGQMRYGGFWIRFAAIFVDGLVTTIGGWIIMIILGFAIGTAGMVGMTRVVMTGLVQLLIMILTIAYVVFFLGTYGATLGKMVFGLKVVRSNGDKITYGRALGRLFASYLSSIILCIGYIMAAFDDEKRALHDRICDTRVIRT